MTHWCWIGGVGLTLALSECQAQPASGPGQAAQAIASRNMNPDVPAGDLEQLVAGNSEFAWALYQEVRRGQGNIFYSPYSISTALAMTYAGARGDTEQAMARTMRYTLPQPRLHAAFDRLDLTLASRAKIEGAARSVEGFQLNVANRIWSQTGFSFLSAYLDTLAQNYASGLSLLDFKADPEAARRDINTWASQQTAGRIKDLLPTGVIDSTTRLVLTNAIYFKAAWRTQFGTSATRDEPFHRLDGSSPSVRTMHQSARIPYASGADYQALELPYVGDQLALAVILPAAGQFTTFETDVDARRVRTILDSLTPTQVDLALPKFKCEWAAALKDVLSSLGMASAFSSAADFSGMNGGEPRLVLQNVIHKSFVAVDEQGTEAAAATAVGVGLTAMPSRPVVVRIDRPFLFVIRDRSTGTLLFVGRILSPGE